jgi:hypothetical protein
MKGEFASFWRVPILIHEKAQRHDSGESMAGDRKITHFDIASKCNFPLLAEEGWTRQQ